jgi:hypothetical protein
MRAAFGPGPQRKRAMIRISKITGLTPGEVIDRASRFFGSGGVGLRERDRTECCVVFEGGGGYVSISVIDEEGKRKVDVETREWDYHAREFLREL